MSRILLAVAVPVALLGSFAGVASADVKPFGKLDCVPQDGIRVCQGSAATRVPTFDGVPLDVNVALPASGDKNLPLIVRMHGWGGSKDGFDADTNRFARDGYAVLSYSARGFGESCGSFSSRLSDPQGCAKGWVHLADSRYEVRDTQYLAGLLADQGLVNPTKIGVTGVSYGGGQSLMLATLRNRMRLTDGSYVPWTSPARHVKMRIAASAPVIPWSDLVYSLMPNGRTLDYGVTSPTADLDPIGIEKASFVTGLFALGQATGHYAPPGVDQNADLQTWFALINAGEPYQDAIARPIVDEIANNHSAYYLASDGPAPILIANGFTDDLFPVDEAIRYANKYPRAQIAQMFMDFGHMRGQNKAADEDRLRARIHDWFDRHVKGKNTSVLKGVEALTQTCPASEPSGGPFFASSWKAIHPGEVRFADVASKQVTPNDTLGLDIDPIAGQGACAQTDSADQSGTATYRLPPANGYTLMGAPTVIAELALPADPGATSTELAARLWDVGPDGQQTLVARGLYRPSASGPIVFQLHANGWKFASGHVPKLELLGRDAPYARPSNFPSLMNVSNLELRLPVHDNPGGQVSKPAPPVLP